MVYQPAWWTENFCHAIDFNDAITLNKLWGALKGNASKVAKLSAPWECLSYSKQSGRHLRATIFAFLATEAELEVDKLARHGAIDVQEVLEVIRASATPAETLGIIIIIIISIVTKKSDRATFRWTSLLLPCYGLGKPTKARPSHSNPFMKNMEQVQVWKGMFYT